MIRNQINNLEPGSITIQTRGAGTNTVNAKSPQPQQPQPQQSQPHQSQPQQPQQVQQSQQGVQNGRRSREGTTDRGIRTLIITMYSLIWIEYKSRGGKRESKKIYTPKQVQQAPSQVSQPLPNTQASAPVAKKGYLSATAIYL